MKCIVCGKDADFGPYCKDCLLKKEPLIKRIKAFALRICPKCNAVFFLNKWHSNLNNVIKKYLKKAIVFNEKYETIGLDILSINLEKNILILNVEIRAKIYDENLKEIYQIEIPYEYQLCNKCKRNDTQYYEAIVQFRNVPLKIIQEFENLMKQKKVYVNKIVKHKNGFDYYVTDKRFAKSLIKNFVKKYGGNMKFSAKLYTRDKETSKEVYRLTILYKFNDVEKNKKVRQC